MGAGQVLEPAQRVAAGAGGILRRRARETDRDTGRGMRIGHGVRAVTAREHVVAATAFERVVKRRSRQVLDIGERIALGIASAALPRRQADIDPCQRRRVGRRIGTRAAVDKVRAAQARNNVTATLTEYEIVAGRAVERVASIGAIDDSHCNLLRWAWKCVP